MVQVNTTGDADKSVATMTPDEAKAELAKREADKMTRRAALAKVGLRTGMAIFAAFSIDDLARKTAAVLSLRASDNRVVEKMAHDLHNAGVAFADENTTCAHCCSQYCKDLEACFKAQYKCNYCDHRNHDTCTSDATACLNNAKYAFDQCDAAHCTSTDTCPSCPPFAYDPCTPGS